MAVMRSWFFVAGHIKEELDVALNTNADIVVLDVEDNVPPTLKDTARRMVWENLDYAKTGNAEVWVRVNDYTTEMTSADLDAVVYPGLDGIILTKVRGREDVLRLAQRLDELEHDRGIKAGSVSICLLLETALGIVHAYEACSASPRVKAAIFGAVDFTKDMGVEQTPEAAEQAYARSVVGVACRAANIVAVDAPFLNYEDMEAYRKNVNDGKQLGYNGRMILHTSMVDISNKMYGPSDELVAWAKDIKEVFEKEGVAKGKAAITHGGKLVDTPVYTKALNILERQKEIAEKDDARK